MTVLEQGHIYFFYRPRVETHEPESTEEIQRLYGFAPTRREESTVFGWFLSQAAAASYAEIEASTALSGVRVGDVMSEDCPMIDGRINLRALAEDHLLRTGRRCFVVLENGR